MCERKHSSDHHLTRNANGLAVIAMSWLHYIRELYSLDTLDTRFTKSSRTPPKPTEDGDSIALSKLPAQEVLGRGGAPDAPTPLPEVQPSRWQTPEFYFYYFCFLTIPFLMVKAVYDVSKGSDRVFISKESIC